MQPSRFPGIDDQLDELVAQNQGARADRVQPTSSRYPAIDAHLGDMQRSERLAVETTLDLALPRNPDKAAEAQTLADRFRLDMATVQAKQDELARIARGEDIRKALVASPILRRQMTDMKFAEIAHDDVETLSGIESVMGAIKNTPAALKAGLQSASSGVVGLAQMPFDLLDPVGELFSGTILPENPLRRVSQGLGEYRKWIDDQAKAAMPKGSGNVESGYYSGMASLSRNVASLPLLFTPGGQRATLSAMVAPVVGEEYGQARDAGLTPTQSLVYGSSQGAIEYATEKLPVAKLLGDLKVGETFLKTLAKQALYEVPGEQAATILQDLNTWAAIDSNKGKTLKDYLADRPDAAVQTLVATLVGTGGQVSVVKAVDMAMGHIAFKEERAAAAEQHAAALGQMGEMIKASKALARSPQSVAQFVQEAAKEQGAENVYVDAKVFNQLVQETGAMLPGPLRDQLAEATARGGDVVIPVGTFATEIASTEYGAALADHVKLDPNGMSRAEAVEFMATQGEQLQQEVERTLTQQESTTAFQASREVVQGQIQQELDALGRFTPEKNAADAVLFASYYATRAAQLGVTPEALFDQRRVQFAAEAVAGQQFDQAATLQQLRDELQSRKGEFDGYDAQIVGGLEPDADTYFGLSDKVSEAESAFISQLEQIPDDAFGLQASTSDGRMVSLNPSAQQPGKYQLTRFTKDGTPWGDTQYPTKKQALADFLNEVNAATVRDFGGQLNQPARQDQTETPAFREWFGESKVVDSAGKPLVVYHGTTADFNKFDPAKRGSVTGVADAKEGFFFAASGKAASEFTWKSGEMTGNVMPVYLSMQNPMRVRLPGEWAPRKYDKALADAKAAGHDGLIVEGATTLGTPGDYYIAFRPEQIKSATGNRGTFDPNDPNILHQGARGAFSPESLTITLLKGADLSTALHEAGHFFLEMDIDLARSFVGRDDLNHGERQILSDVSAVLRWFGIDGSFVPGGRGPVNSVPNRLKFYAQQLRDSAVSKSGIPEGNRLTGTKPLLGMFGEMAGAFNDPKVFDSVVRSLPVDVVNMLALEQLTPDMVFHDAAMLEHVFTVGTADDVAIRVDRSSALASLLVETARSTAEVSDGPLDFGGAFVEGLSAEAARDDGHDVLSGMLNVWGGLTFEEKRSYHERFAESWERYLFDGNAPSVELAPYFQRFREWMLSVYKSIKDFLTQNPEAGKLDDTVRGVFDRMLATREQIEIAQAARSMMPLFASAEQGGYTAQEFQAYQEMARQSSDAAADELEARALRDMAYSRNARGRELKRLQREAAALRSEARIEARRQVMSQPVYRAWQFLKGRLSKDDKAALKQQEVKATIGLNVETDSLFVAIAKLGGLDRGSVERMWGWDAKERSPQPAFGQPLLRRDGGLSVDAMGERLAEVGYLTEDGTSDFMAEFEEKFGAEYRGDLQYSMSYDYAQSMERRAGDNIAPGQLSAGRIDMLALKDMALPPAIAERLEELGMTARDGLHPDVAVDMIPGINTEFANGEQLVRALAQAPDLKEAIEDLTDRMMLEQHGELATPEAIERSADLAVHNEVRARMVATELNAIHRMAGKPKILATAAREYAGKMINRLMLASVKPHLYAAAKARAARASEKAFKAGDLEAAAVEKRNELINAYAAVAAKDALAEARATVKYFNALARGSDKKTVQRGMDPDVLNAARFILGAYGVGERAAERAADYLDVLRRNNPEMSKVLEPSITATLANARPLEQLTIEQLRGLREEIEAMAHLAKRSRMLEIDGNLLDREEVVAELDAKLEEIGVPEVIPGEKSAITPMEKAKSSLQYAGAILRRVEQWAEAKDGAFGGPFLRYVFQPVKEAADRYRTDRSKYRKAYLDLVKGIAPSMKSGLIEAPELGYTFGKGHNGVAMAELLHAILHTGNESNKRKLLLGRGWAVDLGEGQMDTGRWDAFIARMHREGILKREHYDFAQGVWDLLDSMKPAAQKTHRDVFGMYFQEVTADEFNTPFGTYRGGYVPAQADPQIVKDASLRELAEQENQSMAYSFPTTSKGFTKARVEYNRPLKLDLRSLSQHIDKVLLFTHMEPAVRDVNRVLTDKGLSGKLARVDPAAIDGMLAPWLKRSASQQVETPIAGDGGVSRVLSSIRSRAGMALMFGNISNTLQQVTGLVGAANKVRPGLLAKATASYLAGPKAMANDVSESSIFMKERMANEVAAIHNQMSEILLDPSYLERGQAWTMKHAYFLQSAMDNVIGPIVWTGAYNQALQSGMEDTEAVRFADGTVRQTQGTTLPEDVSRIETGPAYARLFTQFLGYFNMLANTNATELQKVMRETGIKKGATKALGIVFFGLLSPAWIAEAIAIAMRGGPDDDDDDGYLDDWLMQVAGLGTVKFALAGIPFAGQFMNAGINRWNGNPVDDRVSLSPGVSLAEGAVGAPYSVYQAMVNDGNASKAVKDVGTAVTLLTGLPAHWAARPLGYLTGIAQERIEPEGPLDVIRGLVTGTASPESRQ